MPEKRRASSESVVTTIVHNLTSLSIKPLTSWKIARKHASCRNASKRITRTFPYKGWSSPRDHRLNTHRRLYHDETETRPVCHFINQITRGLLRQGFLCYPGSLNFWSSFFPGVHRTEIYMLTMPGKQTDFCYSKHLVHDTIIIENL